jgi:hypothetical protein
MQVCPYAAQRRKIYRKKHFMKLQVIVICLIFTGIAQAQSKSSERETGVVCVSSVPKRNSGPISLGNPDGGNRSFNYTIQIGSQKVNASTERTTAIDGLSLNKTHLVKILRDGKLVESFRFNFAKKGSNHLCLSYKSLYETWSLWPAKDAKGRRRC